MTIPTESPVAAVSRVLFRELSIDKPSNMLVMMLIDAVRETTPPPREVTIGMLTKILQSLDPAQALDDWAVRSSREIVRILFCRSDQRSSVPRRTARRSGAPSKVSSPGCCCASVEGWISWS